LVKAGGSGVHSERNSLCEMSRVSYQAQTRICQRLQERSLLGFVSQKVLRLFGTMPATCKFSSPSRILQSLAQSSCSRGRKWITETLKRRARLSPARPQSADVSFPLLHTVGFWVRRCLLYDWRYTLCLFLGGIHMDTHIQGRGDKHGLSSSHALLPLEFVQCLQQFLGVG
jgi:hypothetical protein